MNLDPFVQPDGTSFVPVHFLYRSPRGTAKLEGAPLGPVLPATWKVACMPYLGEIDPDNCRALPFQRSEDFRAVTCPRCLETEEYAKAKAAFRV